MPRGALIGSRIRDRRVAAGMRQTDLAREAGISPSYLNLIEHNRRRIGGKVLAGIARALGCEVAALTEGGEVVLLGALREAAAAAGGHGAESDRIEEFAGRFPGWAALLAERHGRVEALQHEVVGLADRLAHDPQLSASLHELLSAVTAVRSSASILAGTDDMDPAWVGRFLGILDAEGRRLAEGAEALVRYLDGPPDAGGPATSPLEEVEAFLNARGWHLQTLEATEAAEAGIRAGIRALIGQAEELRTAAGRELAWRVLRRWAEDARRLPLAALAPPAASGAALAARLGLPVDLVLRRLGMQPDARVGLVIADGAGAITLHRALPGFAMPRHGAACPLWPLFQALTRPGVPVAALLEMPGSGTQRFCAEAIALPVGIADYAQPPVIEATMLLTPVTDGKVDLGPPLAVGPTCRICPRQACPARREPSILAPARDAQKL